MHSLGVILKVICTDGVILKVLCTDNVLGTDDRSFALSGMNTVLYMGS